MIPELLQFLRIIPDTDKPAYTDLPYETLKNMTLLDRIKATNWNLELICIGFTVAFVILFTIGDRYNEYLVKSFLKGVSQVFESNFAQFGVDGKDKSQLYVKDSSEAFSSYATGRENIAKVDIKFKLQPRHNLFVWIMEGLLSYFTLSVPGPSDRVDIIITPFVEYDNFIAAVVTKDGMDDLRRFNYFLSLTKTTESPQLPETFVFMSEAADFHNKTFTEKFTSALTSKASSWFRYVAFTDQQNEKPESVAECAPKRKIILSSTLVTGKDQLEIISQLLEQAFEVIDKFGAGEIKFESLKKVLQTREKEVAKFKKLAEEVAAEKLADEKAEQLRKEREAIRKLSPVEQEKIERKAREKKERKAMKKMKVRG